MRTYKNPPTILRANPHVARPKRTYHKQRSIWLTAAGEQYLQAQNDRANGDALARARKAILDAITDEDGTLRRGFQFGRLDERGQLVKDGATC